MKTNIFFKISLVLVLSTVALFLHSSVTGFNSTPVSYPFFHKGMTYVTWSREGFSTPSSDESLRSMMDAGITSVAIVATLYQEYFNSTEIVDTDRTPSDASMRHAIRQAKKHGMHVMIKPQIDLIHEEGNTRSDIGFNSEEKWKEWFSNYSRFIIHYAKMAEEEGADFFCVGTELTFASTMKAYWTNLIIPDVRNIFRGQITYAANWDEYANIDFWEDLDYIGIDSYFPLSNQDNPSLEDLKEGWKKWLLEIEMVQRRVNKPVLMTEAGYSSIDSAARKPWEETTQGKPNAELQAACYRALLETFWDKPWFFGVYWWNWNTYPRSGGLNNKYFTPQNKPALDLVKLWYSQPTSTKLAFGNQTVTHDAELLARIELEGSLIEQRQSSAAAKTRFTGTLSKDTRSKTAIK